ncbi:MAG TPA: thioredoxin family protein [Deinococcales bacterium]|nr:thioredoxin family protein [Deinococcales bacterium]
MNIKVLGPGCRNCQMLEERVIEAARELNLKVEVEKVTDYPSILGFGATSTPALVVDGQLVLAGKVPATSQLKDMLRQRDDGLPAPSGQVG